MRKLTVLAAATAMGAFMAGPAVAADLPSAKAAAALGPLVNLGIASATIGDTPKDTGFVTVLRTFIKTPNQKELAFDFSLQCGLVTDTTVKSKGGNKDTSKAEGSITVRVKVTDEAGNVRFAEPSEGGPPTDPDGVTYCNRVQTLSAKFAGLECTADPETGEVTCVDPEELQLILETLDANAFNFLLADVSPGVQDIEVQARAQANVELSDTELGDAKADAFAGLGSLLVEEIRLIHDDIDGDGVKTTFDNCPFNANPDQLDADGDDVGAVCDADDSDDTVQ